METIGNINNAFKLLANLQYAVVQNVCKKDKSLKMRNIVLEVDNDN